MTHKRKYSLLELQARDREETRRKAEAAKREALQNDMYREMDDILDRVNDGEPAFPGLVRDDDAWMPRSDLRAAYYEAFPESQILANSVYAALRECSFRESMRKGVRGFYGHRPEGTPPAASERPTRTGNISHPLAALTALTRGRFIGDVVATAEGGWVTRREVSDLLFAWSVRSGVDLTPGVLYAALAELPRVEQGMRRGVRGFRGLARVA